MAIELLAPSVEIGLVTTNLEPMVEFYETFLGLPFQLDLDFPGGTMKRYLIGDNTLKLVTYDQPPPAQLTPGGGRAQTGVRYLSLVVANVTAAAAQVQAAGYEITEQLVEFAAMPGIGYFFVADPDGNWVELAGPI
ncbi:catechol 2,3-dioxygenase-like lactoylglutathione lyase family enzyme [Mycolicibacterium sp. BK556]|uniref:VOC family protein n=1 Tax=unclassified Mycolicibacterium TaxID=2636767 RepID=UPI00160A2451|nr:MULTISPECIES: VOC family protein [unclassified Mycolicibacterium]MBB3600987.1 catechol 2,3-dioxygenase-like lactoylglutathione lyase family enzyme [Mycolicibacterium sp. BK556]MBB3630741.1 catechol 2,3-dioxygenase-like lactoylglutathione lyase family enzyme [Mycolicibacterium sp. BK607]